MKEAIDTFSYNHPGAWAEARDIGEIEPADVRKRLALRKGALDVLVGAAMSGFFDQRARTFSVRLAQQAIQGLRALCG
jgi:hypothetical protein